MRIVVVGASVAGVAASVALREAGFEGELVLVGDESREPYDRPPLSKQLLAGAAHPADIQLPGARRFAESDIDHLAGWTATALDVERRELELDGEERIGFDGLLVATGSRARRLALGAEPAGVHVLRTLADSLAIRSGLERARDVVVIGAGFIGLEVASSARALGRPVTVLEAAPRPMARLFGDEIAGWFTELHAAEGTPVRCGVSLEGFEERDGHVSAVRLAGGESLAADLVVVGIGAVPNDDWLRSSGLPVADGVVCDETLRAGPGIYAAGDVARWQHPLFGSIRVEHWSTAGHHGRTAARNLVAELSGRPGERAVAEDVPYFWSDQCGCRVQMAGWVAGHDEVEVVEGGRRRLARFGRDGRLVAALTLNSPAELARQRRAIAAGESMAKAGCEHR